MKKTTILAILALAISLIACQSSAHVDKILSSAQSRMNSRPDSALLILENLDPETLHSRSLKARYALLYSQALDKNYIDLQSDSVIAPAVDYYSKHGRASDRAYTNYYLGCVRYNAGRLDEAVQAMVAAETYASRTEDNYLLARIYSSLGCMYMDQHSLHEADSIFLKAEICYSKERDTASLGYAILNRALVYSMMNKSSDAIAEYFRARDIFEYLGDSANISEMTRNIVNEKLAINKASSDSLKLLLQQAYSISGIEAVPHDDYSMWGVIYLREKNLDSARYFGKLALADKTLLGNRRCGVFLWMCEIETNSGNYREACNYWQAYYKLFDSISASEKTQLIQEADKRYRNQELTYANNLLRMRNKYISIAWSVALVLCVAIIAIVYVRRIRKYRQFIDTLNDNYDTFKERYLRLSDKLDRSSAEEFNLLSALERLLVRFQDLLDKGYKANNPQTLIKEFKDYAKKIGEDRSIFADWQFVVNKQYFGLVDHLRIIHPDLTYYELDMLCMLQLKFPFNCIRLLHQHDNIYSLYSRRTKIHKKLGLESGSRIEDYLTELVEQLKEKSN